MARGLGFAGVIAAAALACSACVTSQGQVSDATDISFRVSTLFLDAPARGEQALTVRAIQTAAENHGVHRLRTQRPEPERSNIE